MNTPQTARSVDDIVQEYKSLKSNYDSYVSVMKHLLSSVLTDLKIDFVTIEARAKEVESFRTKIQRDDKDYTDPIKDVTDLAGLRIVTYQLEDIDKVIDVIRDNFDIDEENSVDKASVLDADRFGYLSVHFVVKLKENRITLPEYKLFTGLKMEIQIRTVLQHAWAAIDHKLRYKRRDEIPKPIRRKLYRISALLETADSEFESLRTELAKTLERYQTEVERKDYKLEIDVDSIKAYVSGAPAPKSLFELSQSLGCVIIPYSPNAKRVEYSKLIEMLNLAGFKSIDEFDKLIHKKSKDFKEILKDIVQKWGEVVSTPSLKLALTTETILQLVILYSLPPESVGRVLIATKFGNILSNAVEFAYKRYYKTDSFSLNQL
ncbi:MAG: hypothetical protein QM758_13655 [Armatimonas sp.]